MQNNLIQPAMQPFIKLFQQNMALVAKFSISPAAIDQALANAQSLAKGQKPASGADILQSNEFAQLMQGMIKNYTEFMTEIGQTSMAMLSQGQADMVQKMQDANQRIANAGEARNKRSQ